jgi:hypothetical protein
MVLSLVVGGDPAGDDGREWVGGVFALHETSSYLRRPYVLLLLSNMHDGLNLTFPLISKLFYTLLNLGRSMYRIYLACVSSLFFLGEWASV